MVGPQPPAEPAKLRVCVLQCSHEGSTSVLASQDVDPYRVPEVYDPGEAGERSIWHGAARCASVPRHRWSASKRCAHLAADGKYQWEHAYIKKATAVQQVRA